MTDDANIARYIPKKYHSLIDATYVDADFNNSKNRTFQHYFVIFKDGKRLDAVSLKDLKYKFDHLQDFMDSKKVFGLTDSKFVISQILEGVSVRSAILCIMESRKFVKGEKFIFTDKYGSTHECTVLDKNLFDEEDYEDYAIGTMTFSYPTLGNDHKETVRILKSEQRDSYGDEYFVSDRRNGIANWVFPNRK